MCHPINGWTISPCKEHIFFTPLSPSRWHRCSNTLSQSLPAVAFPHTHTAHLTNMFSVFSSKQNLCKIMAFNLQSGLRIPSSLNPAQRQCLVGCTVHRVLSVGRPLYLLPLFEMCLLVWLINYLPPPSLVDSSVCQSLAFFSFLKIFITIGRGMSGTVHTLGSEDSPEELVLSFHLFLGSEELNSGLVGSFLFLSFFSFLVCRWHHEYQKCSVNTFNETLNEHH